MKRIGGNIVAKLQIKGNATTNEIGENINQWIDKYTIKGFLDLSNGDSYRHNFNAKIQESTHVFICDYFKMENVEAEDSRIIINGKMYDVTLIDNPMELNQHYEIYLKYVGGQNGS